MVGCWTPYALYRADCLTGSALVGGTSVPCCAGCATPALIIDHTLSALDQVLTPSEVRTSHDIYET